MEDVENGKLFLPENVQGQPINANYPAVENKHIKTAESKYI